jgi:hypothetical protein
MVIPQAVLIVGGLAAVGIVVLNALIGMYERVRGTNHEISPDQLAHLDERMARMEAMMQSIALELEHANELQRINANYSDVPRLPQSREGSFRTPH